MKKFKKAVYITALTSVLFVGYCFGNVDAAGCSNWYTASVGKAYCKGPCGKPEGPLAHLQDHYQKRKCVRNNGTVYYQNRVRTKKLGCC